MILLTRLNGTPLGVNADLIERIDVTPDTVITLVDGKKFVVTEPIDVVIDRVVSFRASVLAATEAHVLHPATPPAPDPRPAPARPLRLLAATRDEPEGDN